MSKALGGSANSVGTPLAGRPQRARLGGRCGRARSRHPEPGSPARCLPPAGAEHCSPPKTRLGRTRGSIPSQRGTRWSPASMRSRNSSGPRPTHPGLRHPSMRSTSAWPSAWRSRGRFQRVHSSSSALPAAGRAPTCGWASRTRWRLRLRTCARTPLPASPRTPSTTVSSLRLQQDRQVPGQVRLVQAVEGG